MGAADVAEVGLALNADHEISADLVIAADLAAADEGTAVTAAEVIGGNDREERGHLGDLQLLGPSPAPADVAADVASGPVVDDWRLRLENGRLDPHVRGDR